jgi:Rrf2 family protein
MSRIINLSESTLIAFHSLILMAQTSSIQLSTKLISQKIGASENTISKVLQRLVKDGFITSNRGPAGGFSLARTPQSVSLLDIYQAIEGRLQTGGCPFNNPHCTFGECIFEDSLSEISREVVRYLKGKTLAHYINKT